MTSSLFLVDIHGEDQAYRSTELGKIFDEDISPVLEEENSKNFKNETYLKNEYEFDRWKNILKNEFDKIYEKYGSIPSKGSQWIFSIIDPDIYDLDRSEDALEVNTQIGYHGPVKNGTVVVVVDVIDEQRNIKYFPEKTTLEMNRGDVEYIKSRIYTLDGNHTYSVKITDPENKITFHKKIGSQYVHVSWSQIKPKVTSNDGDILKFNFEQAELSGIVSIILDPDGQYDTMIVKKDGEKINDYSKNNPAAFLKIDKHSGIIEIILIKNSTSDKQILSNSFFITPAYAVADNPVESKDVHIMYSRSYAICNNVICENTEKEHTLSVFWISIVVVFTVIGAGIYVRKYFYDQSKKYQQLAGSHNWIELINDEKTEEKVIS